MGGGGGGGGEEAQLKGLSKYFNSVTLTGRANVAKATYAVTGVLIAWAMLRPKKPKAPKGKGGAATNNYSVECKK